jgi:hypothetical protein
MDQRIGARFLAAAMAAVVVVCLGLSGACSDSGSPGDADQELTILPQDARDQPEDLGTPDPGAVDTGAGTDEGVGTPDVPVTSGCGDGVCQGAETGANCAKDCLEEGVVAAFVFAHKGDDLASLGRIFDLAQGGADIYLFFVTFDEVPLADKYGGDTGKLAPASLGVSPDNIYTYESYIEWGIVTGSHEVLDRLVQHLAQVQPTQLYVPQLCGGDLEGELAHAVAYWAAKRAKIQPDYFEVPVPSNYYVLEAPSADLATSNPDGFVDKFVKRWKLIPKGGEELKPTLGTDDIAQLRLAAAHIQNPWFQDFLYKLPEDRLLYLLREVQRFRQMPPDQLPTDKPFQQSMDNPAGLFIYSQQGYSHDDFKAMAKVVESFYGANFRTDPSALPYYDEPLSLMIMQKFDLKVDIRVFSPEEDTLSFKIGFGPAKDPTTDCVAPDDLQVSALQTTSVTIPCKAEEPIGQHTYYVRIYSEQAAINNDAAKFTEIPVSISVGQ